MSIKLIALDLDGTLFNSMSVVSDKNKQVVKAAMAAGTEVIISTGRPYAGLPFNSMEEMNIRYAITANGAGIYRFPEKTCLQSLGMDSDKIIPVLQQLHAFPIHMDAFIDGNAYSAESMRPLIDRLTMKPPLKKYIRDTRTVVADIAEFIQTNHCAVQKITMNFVPEEVTEEGMPIRDHVLSLLTADPYFKVVSGGFNNLELTRSDVSKASGMNFLCDLLGIDPAETMACGDSENDLDIVTAAGTGVAMANASDILKEAADYISPFTNDEDGVAECIGHFCNIS